MKYYTIKMTTGFAGMDAYDILGMPDDATEDEIADEAYHMAVGHAEMYGIYPASEYAEDALDWDAGTISDNIDGYSLGEYAPELHDRYRSGGDSFLEIIDKYRTVP